MSIPLVRIAATLCFLAVALGAFGAHAFKSTLESHGLVDVWNKAVLYHFVHAIALLVLALYYLKVVMVPLLFRRTVPEAGWV